MTRLSQRHQTETAKQLFKPFRRHTVQRDMQLVHDPAHHAPNRFTQQLAASLAHRRQFHAAPFTHARLRTSGIRLQLRIKTPKPEVRSLKPYSSGLTHSITKLTGSQSQFLFAVTVRVVEKRCFRARPTVTISLHMGAMRPTKLLAVPGCCFEIADHRCRLHLLAGK